MGRVFRTLTLTTILVTVATLLWIAYYRSFPVFFPEKKRRPDLGTRTSTFFPSLSQECFAYNATSAENTCCHMMNFISVDDIRRCILGVTSIPETSLPPDRRTYTKEWTQKNKEEQRGIFTESGSSIMIHNNTVNWAFIGDSHTRYLVCAILSLMKGPDFQCRISEFQGKWKNIDYFLDKLPRCRYKGEFIMLRHVHSPFTLTYYQDVYLTNLPKLVKLWEAEERPKPTFVVMNTGNHWMRYLESTYLEKGVEAAGKIFEKHLQSIVPVISRLARTTPVIFKMQDDLQVAYIEKPKVKSFTVDNIRKYNALYRQALKKTGVVFWDSTLPLSRAYNQECLKNPRHFRDTLWWMCKDVVHVGYILVRQYADMVLNAACGRRMSNCS
ncbi:uncharacterized protein LOC119596074 [Penaeus monodon]|uniref:uncharacterized protein LOC119596074 n=1 Tax=Penaeus monodon TaxID=6687 RepID=UPI0018A764F1|nr:uncharacterized protein LOC119596074 [Penaeus monodon]XP_037801126.1 uncharacterized protein LOC119596074 [Penaeus monodon]XP_037801127.1 uncharacterized protein LOC119596074 [Penaeus monodon]XP_037801128.1 uncharacterized protein LOC119596074 [Penaeus monodon]XP_037801129.1 uncharacterized protein LOC119596074 [Penaeus monodon]